MMIGCGLSSQSEEVTDASRL
jgi:hypothetical protein